MMVKKGTKNIDQIGSDSGRWTQKYFLDDAGRELLYKLYDSRSETITYLAEKLNVPRARIKYWARQCGITHQQVWTPEALDYLERYYPTMSLADLAEKLAIKPHTIQNKAHQLGLRRFDNGYTAASLADALGVVPNTVGRWIKQGWLPDRRRKSHHGDGWEGYYFTVSDVRNFIIAHPERIKPTQENWLWLVDILAGGKLGLGQLGSDEAKEANAS